MSRKVAIAAGSGRLVNISSSGLLFQTADWIEPGVQIEVSVDWPARLDNVAQLHLHVTGRVVRVKEGSAGIRIAEWEIRPGRIQQDVPVPLARASQA